MGGKGISGPEVPNTNIETSAAWIRGAGAGMVLVLEASFPDSGDGVFWAGERLTCRVVLRNAGGRAAPRAAEPRPPSPPPPRRGILSSVVRSVARGAWSVLGFGDDAENTEDAESADGAPLQAAPDHAGIKSDAHAEPRGQKEPPGEDGPRGSEPDAANGPPLHAPAPLPAQSPAPSEADFASLPPPSPGPRRPASGGPPAPPRTERLAYGFVQLAGLLHFDPGAIAAPPFDALRTRAMYHPQGAGGYGGGGSLFAGQKRDGKDDARAIPVYSGPPSILFVDLNLEPGESRTYKYSLLLPDSLPPSHRGRLARFSYRLVIGIQRGALDRGTQNFQVPFRLFNKVEEDFSRPVYDVLNPVVVNTDEASVVCLEDGPDPDEAADAAQEELLDILKRGYEDGPLSPVDVQEEQERIEYLKHPSLHHAMLACQQNSRATFDICKNTEHVAQFVLARTSFRIGDSVVGIIKFHKGTVPCYQISVFLEAVETVRPEFVPRQGHPPAQSRRILAEHHEFCLNTKRTQVLLPIPTNCTPDFVTTAVSLSYGIRIEFITGARDRMQTTRHVPDAAAVHSHGAAVAEVESFDCTIPIKVYGASPPPTLARFLQYSVA
ncbi:Rgp1-domain-containing protein [Hyaloraphidium curvatum]|nr:Rgp1-domain-containing protein [Hyaloraphidium curvatum]